MANYQELANLVWNVADDVLRGLFKPHEYGDITLPFLVLRRLDCILTEDDRKDKSIEHLQPLQRCRPRRIPAADYSERDRFQLLQHLPIRPLPSESRPQQHPPQLQQLPQRLQQGCPGHYRKLQPRSVHRGGWTKTIGCSSSATNSPRSICTPIRWTITPWGQVFEELLRRFSEMSNETSGEHYTPRDVVRLLVSLLFAEHREEARGEGVIRSIFDPCCGTGGMLTIGKDYFREQINPDADIRLVGSGTQPPNLRHLQIRYADNRRKPRRHPTWLLSLRRRVSRGAVRLHDNQSPVRRQLEV